MEPVSIRIKNIVDAKGIKLTTISQNTGIPVNALSKSFMNKRKLTADEMIAVCKFVGIDLGDLNN